MLRVALLCLCAVGCALAVQPQFNALWKLWGHGVNARTPFTPVKSTNWVSNLTVSSSCSFPSWYIPFDSLVSYGPFAIHPIDGRVFIGVMCSGLPSIWIIGNTGGKGNLVTVSSEPCSARFNYATTAFEGYFNFLPDGSLVFGLCGSLVTYNTTTGTMTKQGTGWPAVVLGVANTQPPQLLWSGGVRNRWWTDWGMQSVNLTASGTVNTSNAASVSDSTVMWGVNGTVMYNGHFNQWAPSGPYGLQYWKTPITAQSTPYVLIPECGQTRPWGFASDNEGSVYSSACGPALAKYDNEGNSVWNLTAFEDSTSVVSLFLSDDEQYIYAGDSRTSLYVVSAATGSVVHRYNISNIAGASCNTTVYGPFAARWPVPFAGNHQFLTMCVSGGSQTTFVVIDPTTKKTKNFASQPGFSVTSVLVDGASNVYAIGMRGTQVHVERWTSLTV